MTVLLAALKSRLEAAAPARDGVPADYEQFVLDALMQVSMDAPLRRVATLSLVKGQALYDLPDDFLFLIEVAPVAAWGDNVLLSDDGIVPLGMRRTMERWEMDGAQLRVYPTPTAAAERTLRYAAMYNGTTGVSETVAYAVVLYGQYLVLMQQANALAGDGWKYSIGDESVDKSGQANGLRSQAGGVLTAYRAAVAGLRSGFGERARVL